LEMLDKNINTTTQIVSLFLLLSVPCQVSPVELTYSVGVWPIWHTANGILAHCKLPVFRNLGTVHFTEDNSPVSESLSLSLFSLCPSFYVRAVSCHACHQCNSTQLENNQHESACYHHEHLWCHGIGVLNYIQVVTESVLLLISINFAYPRSSIRNIHQF
jgi:hypothetical protein